MKGSADAFVWTTMSTTRTSQPKDTPSMCPNLAVVNESCDCEMTWQCALQIRMLLFIQKHSISLSAAIAGAVSNAGAPLA